MHYGFRNTLRWSRLMNHSSRLAFFSLAALVGCAAGTSNTFTTGTGTGSAAGGGVTNTGTGSGTTGGGGGLLTLTDGGTGGSAPLDFLAYAHTGTTLFKFEPKDVNAQPVALGDFDNTDGSMFDIAVNKNGDIWGVTGSNAYHIQVQGGVAHCATPIQIGDGTARFYGLTFAPDGWIGTGEALIAGNTAGELWLIDTTTGTPKQHGSFGKVPNTDGNGNDYPSDPQSTGANTTVGTPWQLSGDIVFLANGGSPVGFATVRDCVGTACAKVDTLIQIDMTKLKSEGEQSVTQMVRGQILPKGGCGGGPEAYQQLLGIAAWNDKVYGFSQSGSIVEIDNSDGKACQAVSTSLKWYGAGLTTTAPVQPPPQ